MTGPRFKPLTEAEMSPEQKTLAAAITNGPRQGLRGPFHALLRAPALGEIVQQLGGHVRFKNVLPPPLKELAILVTARFWNAHYEWYAHRRDGITAGLSPALCDAIAEGRRPALSDDEAIVYDFATELLTTQEVGDEKYTAMRDRFGERGVVELIVTLGHYTMIALILNVDRHPVPADGAPLPALKR